MNYLTIIGFAGGNAEGTLVAGICLVLMSLVIALIRADNQENRRQCIVAFIAREMGQ